MKKQTFENLIENADKLIIENERLTKIKGGIDKKKYEIPPNG